jgi:glycine/D-amino acid oxidase-like deaminating enzyme
MLPVHHQKRIYDPKIYAFDERLQHYWAQSVASETLAGDELNSDITSDVAVIGGGYAGLSAAHRLTSEHGLQVAVLEAGQGLGWGASSRNGGFVSAGGVKLTPQEMIQCVGLEETRRYWKHQTAAVESLKALIDGGGFDADITGDGNICVAHHPSAVRSLQHEASLLSSQCCVAADFIPADQFRREFHRGAEAFGGLRIRPGFGIHPLKLVDALVQLARLSGCKLYTRALVTGWRRAGVIHELTCSTGAVVRARKLVIATNAYSPNGLIPALSYRNLPAISSIVVTQPYSAGQLGDRGFYTETPIYNSRYLLSYYRRLPDGRILFGCRGDTSGSCESAQKQTWRTLKSLKRVLPAFSDARVDWSWRGLVSLTVRKSLSVCTDPVDPSIAFAFGCHGSGIATMTSAGRMAADLVAGKLCAREIPAVFRSLPPALPPSDSMLRWGLRAAYCYYAVRDALHV